MFCGKCGTKLDNNAKFCGKCGAKIENINANADTSGENAKSLDSFIGSIVKKVDEQSEDNDIFAQIDIEKNKKPEKKAKKKMLNFGNRDKSKNKKLKSKSKSKSKHKAKKERKVNKKIILIIIISIILLLVGFSLFIFFKYGDDIFADKRIKDSINKTFKHYAEENQSLDVLPKFVLRGNDKDKFSEKEIYLKLQDAKGGLINEDVLCSLKGLSIKTNEKHDNINNKSKIKLTIANSKNEEMYGEVCSTSDIAIFSIPRLYDDILGFNLKENDSAISNSEYCAKLKGYVEFLSQYETNLTEGKKSIEDNMVLLIKKVVLNSEFNLESNNEESGQRIYTTVVDSTSLLESLKLCLAEMKGDEHIKAMLSYAMYFLERDSLMKAESSLVGKIDKLIANIDNAINSDRIENIQLKLIMNKDKTIKEVIFNTVVDGIGLSMGINLLSSDSELNYTTNIKLTNYDSYINFEIVTLIKKSADKQIQKNNTINFSTSFNDKISLSLLDNYNTDNFSYKSRIDFTVNSAYDSFLASYSLDGKYETKDNASKLNIENMKLNVKTSLYNFYFDFNGYIKQQKLDSIDEISLDNVIFIDNMTKDDIEKIKLEIYKNSMKFLDLFGQGKW